MSGRKSGRGGRGKRGRGEQNRGRGGRGRGGRGGRGRGGGDGRTIQTDILHQTIYLGRSG